MLSYYFAAFPDLRYEVKALIGEGDLVVARVRMVGTHTAADYSGQAASGRPFAVDEVDTFQVVDGHITTYDIVWDELAFRRQLGLSLDA